MLLPISHSFAPHCDARQFFRLCGAILTFPRYLAGRSLARLRDSLAQAFGGEVFLFGMGRHALSAAIRSLQCAPGDEFIVCGYTCGSVYNTVAAAGATVVYAEADPGTLGLDAASVERLVTPRTRAIVLQHTFGIPGGGDVLRDLCERNGLTLIEDCAHCCPDESGPAGMGFSGDLLVLSFGREKAFGGVSGGALICRKAKLAERVAAIHAAAPLPDRSYVFLILLFPLLFVMARPSYGLHVGHAFLYLCKKAGILFPQIPQRGWASVQEDAVFRMPNAYAFLVIDQWRLLRRINDHRRRLVSLYLEEAQHRGWAMPAGVRAGLPLQVFPMFLKRADQLRTTLRARNIHLYSGIWDRCIRREEPPLIRTRTLHRDLPDAPTDAVILLLPTHHTTSLAQARRLVLALARAIGEEQERLVPAPAAPVRMPIYDL